MGVLPGHLADDLQRPRTPSGPHEGELGWALGRGPIAARWPGKGGLPQLFPASPPAVGRPALSSIQEGNETGNPEQSQSLLPALNSS